MGCADVYLELLVWISKPGKNVEENSKKTSGQSKQKGLCTNKHLVKRKDLHLFQVLYNKYIFKTYKN